MTRETVVIPSTIQRLRCFMAAEGALRVKPWAGVDETLDTFHRLLVRNAENEVFWTGLKQLLGDISADLKNRRKANGAALDNEVLNAERYDDLLREIRYALLGASPSERGGFVSSLSRLSVPAVGVMFLLGGVVTVGCSEGVASNDDTGADTSGDTETESDEKESDSAVSTDSASDDSDAPDFSEMSLPNIVETVVTDETAAAEILSCIDDLDDSWETGLEALFQGETEDDIVAQLNCLMRTGFCDDPDEAGDYSLDTLLNNCAVAVYLGVRFE